MTENEKIIVELTARALNNGRGYYGAAVFKAADWDAVWQKAVEQNINGLVGKELAAIKEDLRPRDIEKWNRGVLQTIFVMTKKNYAAEEVIDALSDKGIVPLCLKGIITKDLYPVAELRVMGDFDILVKKEERAGAEKLLEEMGFKLTRDELFTELNKEDVHGEIFFSLEDDFRQEPKRWDNVIRENIILRDGKYILTPTCELAYCVVHAAKHFTRSGCGLRNLLDVVVILKNRKGIDFKYAEEICCGQGYEKIFYYMLTAAEHWYGAEIDFNFERADLELTERFLEYLLSYGVFGRSVEGNMLSAQIVRREGADVGKIRRMFFPPRKMMWYKYQYLKKSPLLTPVGWVHRFISAVFIKKYPLKNMLFGMRESFEYDNERKSWLDELGVK